LIGGVVVLAWWGLLGGTWMLLVDTVSTAEVLCAVAAALAGALATRLVLGSEIAGMCPTIGLVSALGRQLARVPADLWLLTVALARTLAGHRRPGRFHELPLELAVNERGNRRLFTPPGGLVLDPFSPERPANVQRRIELQGPRDRGQRGPALVTARIDQLKHKQTDLKRALAAGEQTATRRPHADLDTTCAILDQLPLLDNELTEADPELPCPSRGGSTSRSSPWSSPLLPALTR
jgi:hypothetical protein